MVLQEELISWINKKTIIYTVYDNSRKYTISD